MWTESCHQGNGSDSERLRWSEPVQRRKGEGRSCRQEEKSSEEVHGCSEGNMQRVGVTEGGESSVSCADLAQTPTSRGQCLSGSQAEVLLLL